MPKITFMGAGSTVFAKNVLGDSMMTPALEDSVIALYDIDAVRLEDSQAYAGHHQPQQRQQGHASKPIWAWKTARPRCAARTTW